jgi:PST family polysaccharide transporter
VVFWFGAPLLADVAGSPEATPVVRLLTLVVLIDGVTAVSVGMIQRRFEQDKLMKAIAIGFFIGAVLTVTLATQGAGAYSFVAGQLTQSAVVAVLALRMAGLPFRLGLDREVAARLVVFGAPLAVALGIESMVLYADSLIVGHVLGTVVLGYYLLAFNISSWVPGIVGTAARYVSIPAFSRLAEGSEDDLAIGVRRALPLMLAIVTPIAVVMLVLSGPLVDVLYGSRWRPAAAALQFLAFLMVARMLTALIFDIQTGLGNTRKVVWVNLAWFLALVPAVWAGALIDGIRGAAVANAVVSIGLAVPMAGITLQRCGVDLAPVLRGVLRPLAGGVAAGVVMTATSLTVESSLAQLVLAGGAGTVVYGAVVVPPRHWLALSRRVLPVREARKGDA